MPPGGVGERGIVRPIGSLIDPGPNQTDFSRRQPLPLAVGRHLTEFVVDSGHQPYQPALGALARDDVAAQVAAGQRPLLLIETQAPFLVLAAVARMAVSLEEGLDVLGEIDRAIG